MIEDQLHARARLRGVQPLLYWLVRLSFQPVFRLYFGLRRTGLEHVPGHGPLLVAANHRSFLDPFVIACIARRPLYYIAKQELFRHPVVAWLLSSLGAVPVARGTADGEMLATVRALLSRGETVLIFPEGTRVRPAPPGGARRGVGRIALETGVPVLPVAIIGTEAVRRGWRFRPHRVRVRVGAPLAFTPVPAASPVLAQAAADRIWAHVLLQWESLGGRPPVRRAVVLGHAPRARALARALACASVRVDTAPSGLAFAELVCLAADGDDADALLRAHGAAIPGRAGVLLALGDGEEPTATALAGRVATGPVAVLAGGRVEATDQGFARQLADLLGRGARSDTAASAPTLARAA